MNLSQEARQKRSVLGDLGSLFRNGIRPITKDEMTEYQALKWRDKLFAHANRTRALSDFYSSDEPYIPPGYKGDGAQAFMEPLDITIADGTQISNTVTETIICPDFSIPAFYMGPYKALYVWAMGVCSNVVTTPGTLIHRVRWGGVAGVVLLQSGAQGLDTTARTNALWQYHGYIICRTPGATGTFMNGGLLGQGNVLSSTAANLLPAVLGSAGAPLASGNVAVTVDTTAAKLLSLTGQFSVATSPTNLTCQQRIIMAAN